MATVPARNIAVPDWRYAQFAVVLPMPAEPFPEGFISMTTAGGARWSDGRFVDDSVHAVDGVSRSMKDAHHPAHSRYIGTHLAASLGPRPSGKRGERRRGSERDAPAEEQFRFQHFAPARGTFEYSLADAGHEGARAGLLAAEVLQYRDESVAGSGWDYRRFLVLHVRVQDCSSRMLGRIAQSIRRDRNKVPLVRDEGRGPDEVNLLRELLERLGDEQLYVEDATAGDRGAPTPLGVALTYGGYLQATSSVRTPGRYRVAIPAHRIAVAVPGSGATLADCTRPARDYAAEIGAVDPVHAGIGRDAQWSRAEVWAWALATGADGNMLTENRPGVYTDPGAAGRLGNLKNWSLLAATEGLGLVFHSEMSNEAMRPLSLASSRYVDLMILNLRSYAAVAELNQRLGEERTRAGAAERSLRDRLRALGEIEDGFVTMRDRLWFDSIPKHPLDGEILRGLRGALGVQAQYEDFVDEMNARRDIYRTQFDLQRLEADAAQAEERHAESVRRAQAEEARRKDRDVAIERRERLVVALSVLALVLVTPSFVDLFFEHHGVGPGLLGIGIALGLAAAFGVWWWFRSRREAKKRPAAPGRTDE